MAETGAESGDEGFFWRLPDGLLDEMRSIGVDLFFSGDGPRAAQLLVLIDAITHVKWLRVDLRWVRRLSTYGVHTPAIIS